MKYIDSEKLIAEIERRKNRIERRLDNIVPLKRKDTIDEEQLAKIELRDKVDKAYLNGVWIALSDILSIIDSLQQEQQEGLHFTPLNRLIQKIPSENWNDNINNYAKKLCDCLIKEGYLKDANVLQDYISYMNGNNIPMATMDEQEQPECIYGRSLKEREKYCKVCSAVCKARVQHEQPKIDVVNTDDRIQYASIEAGIKAHAETYSFNIESKLFPNLTKEQQALWRKEIEQACISGGEIGVELAKDVRYKENQQPEIDLEKEIIRYQREDMDRDTTVRDVARHFYKLGFNARKQ